MKEMVRPGMYELQCESSSLYLASREEALYNGTYDDVLITRDKPTRNAKWEIGRVGDGYTIKQVESGMYCAVADAQQFEGQAVVLSSVPTVWTLSYTNTTAQTVIIYWSVSMSNMVWQEVPNGRQSTVRMTTLGAVNKKGDLTPATGWRLKPLTAAAAPSGHVVPGIYTLRNKESGTYVALAPDEKTIGCWPVTDLHRGRTEWEIAPLGDGYSIRMHGTDKYCTLLEGISNKCSVGVSKYPAAWRIIVAESPVHEKKAFCQIYWADTQMMWDLRGWGKKDPGTPVQVISDNGYQACRLFELGQ